MALARPPLSAFARFASPTPKSAERTFPLKMLLMVVTIPVLIIFSIIPFQRQWAQVQPRNN